MFPDGILYASRESHYSVFKAARMYRMDCVKVDTLMSGEIDCADFQRKILQNRDKPAIINVNIGELTPRPVMSWLHMCSASKQNCYAGTTVKGAVDDLDLVIKTLEESGFKDRFYIHCDGALFGLMIPFVKKVIFGFPCVPVSLSYMSCTSSFIAHSPDICMCIFTRHLK